MFSVGQKVECVDGAGVSDVTQGTIYIIERVFTGRCFRPIVERKTSIEVFTRMLRPSKVDA